MPISTITHDNDERFRRRLANLQASIYALYDPIRKESKVTIDDIYDAIGDGLITDSAHRLTPRELRKMENRLDNLTSTILPLYVKKDSFLARSVRDEYNVRYYEKQAELSALANENVFLGNPSKRRRSAAFEVQTNILANSKLLRSRRRVDALNVAATIRNSVTGNNTLRQTSRAVDVALGFRSPGGELTEIGKRMVKQGKKVPRNGQIYNSVRIARTEMARIHGKAAVDEMLKAQADGWDQRLQKISVLDNRTRRQSAQMDRQVSNEQGQFRYPDGRYYYPGDQPARWAINDRGSFITWLPDIPEEEARTIVLDDGTPVVTGPFQTFREWAMANEVGKSVYGEKYNL